MRGNQGAIRVVSWLTIAATAYSLGLAYSSSAAAADPVFDRQVKPILTANCARCHAGRKIKGGLDLSTRAKLLLGGDSGPAVVPGKPADSLLIEVLGANGKPHMPPKRQLPPAAIAELTKWVATVKAADVPAAPPTAASAAGNQNTMRKKATRGKRGEHGNRHRHREREDD